MGLWLHSFLTNRWQHVIANGQKSSISYLLSGVPQGSVLGPLLLLLIIDSLGDLGLEVLLNSFADNSKLAYKIDTVEDALYMQECLDKLQDKQVANNMDFNVKKFNVLKLGRNTNIKHDYNYIVPGHSQVITDNDTV